MTTKDEMPPSQADVGCAIEMLAHLSEPIAAALSDLLAHVRAEARAEGVAAGKAICQTQQHADRIRLGTADNERLRAERADSAHANLMHFRKAGVGAGQHREGLTHVAGSMIDWLQKCARCGVILSDYRNASWRAGEPAPKGFGAGHFVKMGVGWYASQIDGVATCAPSAPAAEAPATEPETPKRVADTLARDREGWDAALHGMIEAEEEGKRLAIRAEKAEQDVAKMREALTCLLDETAPDDFSLACLLCGTRGEMRCCPEVAAARAALEKKP